MSAAILAARSDAALTRFLTLHGNNPQVRRIRQVLPDRSSPKEPSKLLRQVPAEGSSPPSMARPGVTAEA